MNDKLKEILQFITDNPNYQIDIQQFILDNHKDYLNWCKRQNDSLLREALGDAIHLLGMKRRPSDKDMKQYCSRIEKAVFPNGIVKNYHHEGEQRFYARFLEDKP